MISEGPRFKSQLGHHFSMVLSSLSDSWHYPFIVKNVKEMAAPSEMCWANEELEKNKVQHHVVDLSFRPMPNNLQKVGWAN